jgi:transposase
MTFPRAIARQERVVALVRGGKTFREVAALEGVTLYAIESVARQYKRRTGRNASNRWGPDGAGRP